MRRIILSTLASLSLADNCARFCRETSGICSSKGSYCKNEFACHDLYYTDETKSMVCSSEVAGCPPKLHILCAEIPTALERILTPASGSPQGKTRSEEETDKAVAKPITSADSKKEESKPTTKGTAKVTTRDEADLQKAILASMAGEPTKGLRKGDKKKKKGGSASSSSEEEELASAIAMSLVPDKSGAEDEGKEEATELTMDEALARAMALSLLDLEEPEVAVDARGGRIGFRNLGATCYLAAVMQVIGHARPLMTSIRIVNPNPIAVATQEVLSQMWEGAGAREGAPIDPSALLQAIHDTVGDPDQFLPGRMEDASDAMYIIVNALDAASRLEGESTVAKVLLSAQRNTKTCSVCKTASSRVEPQFQLHVPMPEVPKGFTVTLQECLVHEGMEETIDAFACATCDGYTSAKSKTTIARTADLLMITLRRFRADMSKVHTIIEYPRVLVASNGKAIYDLIGVIHHLGKSKDSGHYTAQVFHDVHGEWINANDRAVTSIESPELRSTTAYMFLYQRRRV